MDLNYSNPNADKALWTEKGYNFSTIDYYIAQNYFTKFVMT